MSLTLNIVKPDKDLALNIFGGGQLYPLVVPAFAVLSYNQNQTFAVANVPQPVRFDTIGAGPLNVGLEAGGNVLNILHTGTYFATVQPQVDNGSGTNICTLWPQVDRGDGNGFVSVPNSAARIRMVTNAELLQTLIVPGFLMAGWKLRFMANVSSANMSFAYTLSLIHI